MFEYKFLSKDEFLPLFEKYRPIIFQDSIDFNLNSYYSDEENHATLELSKLCTTEYRVYLTVWENESLVGWSWGYQKNPEEFYMCNSAVLPAFRRKNIYTQMMNNVIEKVTKDGFKEITSKHHADNNAVIIPKLKAGFVILGFEINPKFGLMINLVKYSNPKILKIHNYRTGFKKLN